MTIRPARAEEARVLSDLAFRSKASWGYSDDFMERCRAELTYSAADVISEDRRFAVGEIDGEMVGFYALARTTPDDAELEALFVEPSRLGMGYGRLLMDHAKRAASEWGAQRMLVQGDPHAERFYLASGGVLVGRTESRSIEGRFLPLYEIDLAHPGERPKFDSRAMKVIGILETCLYAEDLRAAERFYTGVMGLDVISSEDGRHVFFHCGDGALLVFNPIRTSRESTEVNGSPIPLHGTTGASHLAFRTEEEDLPAWREHLVRAGVEIESEVEWPNGGRSIYFRDPAGNSIELAPPDIWGL